MVLILIHMLYVSCKSFTKKCVKYLSKKAFTHVMVIAPFGPLIPLTWWQGLDSTYDLTLVLL